MYGQEDRGLFSAFDRVFKDFLMAKLCSGGFAGVCLDWLSSYLEPRIGRVTVDNVMSDVFELVDTVFQGTVLGPALWNSFFHDVSGPASYNGDQETLFADDLSVSKSFDLTVDNAQIFGDMNKTRAEVHAWGRRNRVSFDANKEHINIIHPIHGEGSDFKLLGCLVDVKLTMQSAIDQIACQVRPKIKALLRSRPYYGIVDMVSQFKTHIWGKIEYHHGAILHACDSSLAKIELLQSNFVRGLSITREMAFQDYNLAPLSLRRDIGILGFIHKRVLGECHMAVKALLPFSGVADRWHSKQLETHIDNCIVRHTLYWGSLFGLVHVYNRLPEHLISTTSVKEFQSRLTQGARDRCSNWDANWMKAYSDCAELWKTLPFLG